MRFILDIKDHDSIKLSYEEWKVRNENFKQQWEFLKKQAENLHNQESEYNKGFWEMAESYLHKNKLLPDSYNENTQYLEIDKKSNQMFLLDREENKNPLEILLGMMK